jgi:putative spermidine/putrescine transport system permease protein
MARGIHPIAVAPGGPASPLGRALERLRSMRVSVAVPAIAFMLVFFFVPMAFMFWRSVSDPQLGFDNYSAIANDELYRIVAWNTLRIALLTTAACVVVGYPIAYILLRTKGIWRTIIFAALALNLVVSTTSRTFSWLAILGFGGFAKRTLDALGLVSPDQPLRLLYTDLSVVAAMVQILLPYMVIMLYGAMMRIDQRLILAARTLGAGPRRAFTRVFLPLSLPGLIASTVLVFMYALGFYIVPAVLGGPKQTTIVLQIKNLFGGLSIWGLGSALAATLTLLTIGAVFLYVRVLGVGVGDRRR